MILLGITGRAGAGKSSFCAAIDGHLRTTPAATCWTWAFADALRGVCEAVFGSRYDTTAAKQARDPFWAERLGEDWATGRKILQRLGTEVFRHHVHPEIWLMAMDRRLADIGERGPDVLLIGDVRFDNEAEWVRARGGTIVRVINPHLPPPADGHASEAGIDPRLVDVEFAPPTIEELRATAAEFIDGLLERQPAPPEPQPGMWDFSSEEYRELLDRSRSKAVSGG